MLKIKNLSIKDAKGRVLIEDFTFTLSNTDKVGVIGEEGNGKSTLFKAIINQELIEDYTSVHGKIETDRDIIAYFEQRLAPSWNESTIMEYLLKEDPNEIIQPESYGELFNYEKEAIKMKIDIELLNRDQQMKTLSGGEKVKLRLLKILHANPDILLLDEPTNDLDMQTLEWLESFLLGLSKPLMFISHDETLLSRVSNGIIHLEQLNKKSKARIQIYRGGYESYVESRKMKLEKDIQVSKKEKDEYRKKKDRLNDLMNAVHHAQSTISRQLPFYGAALKTKMHSVKAMEKRMDKEGYLKVDSVEEAIDVFFDDVIVPSRKKILEYHSPTLAIDGKVLIKDIDLSIYGQDKVVIAGANGCGKSLLMHQIYEELKDRSDINLGYMAQNYMDILSKYDNAINFLLESGDREDLACCCDLLGVMKFSELEMNSSCDQLSEGQKAKLFLLKFIKRKCDVLLLDEPTRNLSPLSSPVIRNILSEFKGCIIAVSHDRMFIEEVVDDIYYIENGSITCVNHIHNVNSNDL